MPSGTKQVLSQQTKEVLLNEIPNIFDIENIASFYIRQNNKDKAIEVLKEIVGEEGLLVSAAYNNIGLVCQTVPDFDLALNYFGKALNIYKKSIDEEDAYTATFYNNIGLTHYYKKNIDKLESD